MNHKNSTKLFAILGILFLAVIIPVTVINLQNTQHSNLKAAGPSPTISLNQNSGFITLDANSSKSGSNVISLTWQHTTGSFDNTILLVGIGSDTSGPAVNNVTSVTYNGTRLTKLVSSDCTGARCSDAIWYMQNPPAGAHNVVVNLTKTGFIVAGAASYYNVNPENPFETPVTNIGLGNPTVTVMATSCNQVAVDTAAMDDDTSKIVANPGQTTLWDISTIFNISGASSIQLQQGKKAVFTWKATSFYPEEWADLAVILNPLVSSCVTPTPTPGPLPTISPTPANTPSPTPTPTSCPTPVAVKNVQIKCPNCSL